jgi:hypothetical protein
MAHIEIPASTRATLEREAGRERKALAEDKRFRVRFGPDGDGDGAPMYFPTLDGAGKAQKRAKRGYLECFGSGGRGRTARERWQPCQVAPDPTATKETP